MPSDGGPGNIPASHPVPASQGPITSPAQDHRAGGKTLPHGGKINAATTASHASSERTELPRAAAKQDSVTPANLHSLVAQLNKYVNDSGRPTVYRIDSSSGSPMIQEINPANGEVIGELAASEFPALASSLGASGILVDSHA